MGNKCLLSFILPCYNVERYIAECLDSIYAQDMPETDYEVICVNDASTDRTREIILSYKNNHANLCLVDHVFNKNVGAARNSGLEVAQGEYIWCIDPDDLLPLQAASQIIAYAKKHELDILFFNNECVDEKLKHHSNNHTFQDSEILTGQDYVNTYFKGKMSQLCVVWRCLFRLEFLKKNNIKFPEIYKAEDVVFIWRSVLCAQRVLSINSRCYIYRINPFSIGAQLQNANTLFAERILFGNQLIALLRYDKIVMRGDIKREISSTIMWCVNSNLTALLKLTKQEIAIYYQYIQNNPTIIMKLKPYMNKKHKILFQYNWCLPIWFAKLYCLKLIF